MGTLGHPRNASGGTAFGTSHGAVPVGSTVYTSTGVPIGVVVCSAFTPNSGIDVSYIRMNNNITVSRIIPGTSINITNFFAPTQSNMTNHFVVAHTSRSGNVSGSITSHSQNVNLGGHLYRNMIITNMTLQGGDSGSALTATIGGARVLGTLAGGSSGWQAFSPAPAYQHIGN